MKSFISISLFIGKLLIFKYNPYSNQVEFHNKILICTMFIYRGLYEKVYNIYLIATTSNLSISLKYYISISLLWLVKVLQL